MKKKIFALLGLLFMLALIVLAALPDLLHLLGLYPQYAGEKFNLSGRKVLVICTSYDALGDTLEKTGVYASEMTAPYYEFSDNGMTVDIANIRGGEIPIESISLRWPLRTAADKNI